MTRINQHPARRPAKRRAAHRATVGACVMLFAIGRPSYGQKPVVIPIVPADSRVTILVGKAGVFGFASHTHEVVAPVSGGAVTLDEVHPEQSSVWVELQTEALKVTGAGEPAADVAEVQRTMVGERVLNATKYPKIVFRSRRVRVVSRDGALTRLQVEGDLTLRGTTRAVVVPASVLLDAGVLAVSGKFTLKQTDFGIEPVTAVGGTIRVKDELDITFDAKARR